VHPSHVSPKNKPIWVSRRAEESKPPFPNAKGRTLILLCKGTRTRISIYRNLDENSVDEKLIGGLTFSMRQGAKGEVRCRFQLQLDDSLGICQLRVYGVAQRTYNKLGPEVPVTPRPPMSSSSSKSLSVSHPEPESLSSDTENATVYQQ